MNSFKYWLASGGCLSAILLMFWLHVHRENQTILRDLSKSARATNKFAALPIRYKQSHASTQIPPSNFRETEQSLGQQSYEVRMKFASDLADKSLIELFDLWKIEAESANDSFKLGYIGDALAPRLRGGNPDSAEVLVQIRQFFEEPGHDEYSRWSAAQVLSRAATKETLALLLDLVDSTKEIQVKAWLWDHMVKASQSNWDGQFREDFTDLLRIVWNSSDAEADSVHAVALSIASIGSREGLKLLFSQINFGGQTISEFEKRADEKAWAAFLSLENVRNPTAIEFLSAELSLGQLDSITTSAAGFCLARMGSPESTEVLLRWAQESNSDVQGYISFWFSLMRDGGSVELVKNAIEKGAFANPQNRDQLASVLARWLSQRN